MSDSGTKRPPNSPNRPSGPGRSMRLDLASRRPSSRRAPPRLRRRHRVAPAVSTSARRAFVMKSRISSGSLRPGADSTPVETSTPAGPQVGDGLAPRCRGAGRRETIRRWWSTTPSARRQSKTWPEPGLSPSTMQVVRAELLEAGDGALAGAEGLDHQRHPGADPLRVLGRLVPVQLRGAQPGGVHGLDHPLRRLVAEHPDGQDVLGQALGDVAGELDGDLPRRRGEDEARPPDAPRLTASRASASEVMPQILTNSSSLTASAPPTGWPDEARAAGRPGRRRARASRRPGWRRSRPRPAAGRRPRRGSPTPPPRARRPGSSPASAHARSWSTCEGPQVALVHADDARPRRPAPAPARARRAPRPARRAPSSSARAAQRRQLVVVERRHDQQDGVGAHEAGVGDVGLLHGEVLAQHGQARRLPGGGQVGGRSAEEVGVGQDREAGRPARHVLLGDQVGLEVRVELALGRRAPLDLGDAREPVTPAARRRSPWGGRLPPPAPPAHRARDVVRRGPGPMGGKDLLQVGGHERLSVAARPLALAHGRRQAQDP